MDYSVEIHHVQVDSAKVNTVGWNADEFTRAFTHVTVGHDYLVATPACKTLWEGDKYKKIASVLLIGAGTPEDAAELAFAKTQHSSLPWTSDSSVTLKVPASENVRSSMVGDLFVVYPANDLVPVVLLCRPCGFGVVDIPIPPVDPISPQPGFD
jgi:hypothetical protein